MSDRRNELWKKYGGGDKEKALAGYEQRVQQTAQVQQRDAARREKQNARRQWELDRERERDQLPAAKLHRAGNPQSSHYDPEYTRLSRMNSGIVDPTYRWINDRQFRSDAARYGIQSTTPDLPEAVGTQERAAAWLKANGDPNWAQLAAANLDMLSEDERGLYNYHYAKGGVEQANAYLRELASELNLRKAASEFEKIEGRTGAEILSGIGAGFDQYARGLSGLTSKTTRPTSVAQYKGQMVREDLADNGPKLPKWMGGASLGQMAYDATSTTANMAPSILASTMLSVAGAPGLATWVGSGTMGAGAAGNARQEALAQGYSNAQATTYGLLVGGAEMAMEKILGGISAFGGGGAKRFADKLTGGKLTSVLNSMDSVFLQVAAHIGSSALSEGSEEYVQELLDPVLRNLVLGEDNELALYSPEALYSGLLGALTGGLMEGPTALVSGSAAAAEARMYKEDRLATQDAMQADIDDAVARLEALDIENDALASAIAKTLWGQDLNRRERRALQHSEEGRNVLDEMWGQKHYPAEEEGEPAAPADPAAEQTETVPMKEAVEADTTAEAAEDPLLEAIEAQEIAEAAMAAEEGAENAHSNPVGEADGITEGTVAENATVEPSGISEQLTEEAPEAAQAVEASVENVEETASIPDDSGAEVEPEVQGRTIEEVAGEYGDQAKDVSDLYQDGQDVEKFASAVRAAWEMGGSGIPMERVNSSPRTQGITAEQRRTAYLLGQGAARLAAQSQTAANAKKATGGTLRRKGVVKAQSGITISELSQTFNDRQRSAYKLLSFYAEVTGIDVVLYKGTQEQETGRFAHGEDTIYIDITAGTNGWDTTDLSAYTMMRTFSHEFVHFVEKWSAEQYNQLREVVFSQMEKNGQDAESLVELAMQEQGLTFDQASREVVAEALTDILPDSQFVQTLASKHKSLFEKIKERLEAFVTELKTHWKKLTGNNSREAVALKTQVGEALGYAEEVLQAFSKAAGEAVEAYQATVMGEEVPVAEVVTEETGEEPEAAEEAPKPDWDELGKTIPDGLRKYHNKFGGKHPMSVLTVKGKDGDTVYAGSSFLIFRIDERLTNWPGFDGYMKRLMTPEQFDSFAGRGKPLTEQPMIGMNGKIRVAEFDTPDGAIFCNYDLLRYLDGNALTYKKLGSGSAIQAVDPATGELVGVLMGMKVDGKNITDKKPGKMKSFKAAQTAKQEKPAEAPKQEAQTIADDRFTIEASKGGTVYVTFPGKPDAAVRDALKEQGFKWSPKKKAWYAKDDPARVAKTIRDVFDAYDIGVAEAREKGSITPATKSKALGDLMKERKDDLRPVIDAFNKGVADEINRQTISEVKAAEDTPKAEEAAPVAEASETTIKEETEHEDETEAGGILADRADGPGDSGVLGAGEAGAGAGNDGGRDPVGVPGERGREAVRHGAGADAQRSERGSDDGGSQSRVSELTDEAPAPELSEAAQEQAERSEPREPESSNWVIGDSLDLPQGDKARIRANLDAIAIVKRLEATGQRATAAEQAQLAKYVGWGGLDSIFNDYHKAHATEREELKKLLTDQEFRAARASTTTAFYTDIGIIRAVYDGLTSLGFNGGRILEPAAGVGHFAGAMPAHVRQGIKSMTMVELDSITGAIAKHLYPGMDVRVEGFETTNLPNNYMDAAVGNVPFGNFGVVDKNYPKKIAGTIHNYFFAKTLDKVRPGGIVVMLTSRYTMDSNDSTAREYISKKADLLGAIRLPDSAFKDNAGTEVVSDILIFKKRAAGTPYGGADFVASPRYYNDTNDYFKQHPEMILGTIEQKHGRYGLGTTIKAREGDLGQQIREAFAKIEGKMDYPAAKDREHTNFAVERGARKPKSGGYAIQGGKLVRSENGQMVDHKLDEKTAKRVEGMVGIRDAARKLQNAQLQGQNPASIGKARKELNSLYDAFVKQHGFLNAPANKKAMQDDPDRYSILALENWDTDTKRGTKADIFSKNTVAPNRTVTSAETVEEGLIVSRNQTGGVDTALIARLTGRSEEEVTRELIDTRLAFKRADGTLEAAETYLSGNVRAKLREADGLVSVDADFRNNIEALRPIIPKDIPHTEIFVNPGATWIPAQLYGDFAAELLGGSNSEWRQDVKVTYHPQTGTYAVTLNSAYLKQNARNTQKYGTPRKTFLEILEAVLNSKSITVWDKVDDTRVVNEQATAAANEKAEQLGEELRKWLWKDEGRRAELARLYNEQFNCLVNPKYDGSKLTFNGMNAAMKLRPHQLDAVARIISSGGNTLLAHRVGAGKTFEMAAAAMKLKELGLVKKPMFAVPKSLVAQWGKEFADLFPAARLMVAEPSDFTADNRKTFANRIANGEYDAVIVSYEQFERLPISADFATRLYQEQVDSIVDAIAEAKAEEGKRASVKDLERTRKSLENKIKTLADSAKDDDIRFEELGVDALFVDEAHNFKNLFYTTSMSNVSGLGNRDGSKRAFDLYTKVRYLQQLNGGKGIVFATATPVMNSMAEMFIMQRYLQPQMLHDLGIENFDAWAKQFGEVVNGLEVNPSGTGYRIKQSFSRFKNLPELQLMFRNMADVMTTVPGLKIPKMKGGKPIIVECEPGEFQKAYMKQLAKRVEQVKGKDPREDNMLKITSDGRKIAYTQRMIDPTLPYEEGCKLFRCADNVLETYRKTGEDRGVQMVFLDMATPKGKSGKEEATADDGMDMENARLYEDLRKRLTDGGIPAKEIAFIHDADTDAKKKKLFADVNEGKVRVLIGSTGKMGVGMNAQQRAVAIHHLDAPWRPGDVEQRNGRVYRQGNRNKEVACYYYVTKGSYDARLWNKLDTKQQFVEQAMSGSDVGRDIEDTGEVVLSAAEAMAVATGSPLIIEQVKLENEIKKLESLQRAHSQAVADAMGGLARNQTEAKQLEGYIEKAGQDLKRRTNAWQEKTFSLTIGKKVYKDRKEAGPAMMAAAEKAAVGTGYTTIGSFAGFDLRVVKTAEGIQAMLSGAQGYTFKTYPGNLPYMIKAMCDTAGGIDTSKRLWENRLERTREDIAEQKKLLDKPFDKEQRLREARKRYREVMAELTPKEEQRMDRLEADGDQKQVRRVALTDRQVLELFADEALPKDASAAERDALAIHRKRLERLRTLEQDRAEAGKQYKENQFSPNGDRAKAQEAAKRMAELDKAILKAADEVLSVEEAPVMRRVIQSARDASRRQQAKHDQDLLREYRAKRKESDGQRKYRRAVQFQVKELQDFILHPDTKRMKLCPEFLHRPILEFLATIDQSSKRSLDGGEETRADKQYKDRLDTLAKVLKKAQGGDLFESYLDLPSDLIEQMDEMVEKAKEVAKKAGGDLTLNRMNTQQLRELSKVLESLKTIIKTANTFHGNAMFRHVSQAGDALAKFTKKFADWSKSRGKLSALGNAENWIFWKNVRPFAALSRFGSAGESIRDELVEGQDKLARNTQAVVDFVKGTKRKKGAYTEEEVKSWEKETKRIRLAGENKSVRLTVAQIMGLYCMAKREQAIDHLTHGGFVIQGEDGGIRKVHMTVDDLGVFHDALTRRQRAVADSLQEYMSKQGGEWGNYVTLRRFGIRAFTEEHYYPLATYDETRSASIDKPEGSDLHALLNMSFTKKLTKGAKNAVMAYSIFDVFADHMGAMAQYNAMALPVLDAVKWLNWSQTAVNEKGFEETVGVKTELRRVFGIPPAKRGKSNVSISKGYAESFLLGILKSYNSTSPQATPNDKLGLGLLHRYNRSQVAWNASVVIKQPLAVFRAMQVVNPVHLAAGANPAAVKKGIEEMLKHSGIAIWKHLGFYDVNVSKGMGKLIRQDDNLLDKITDWGMQGAEWADLLTWAVIWNGCKHQCGGNLAKTAELFNKAIYESQVVDSVLTKTEYMRDQGLGSRLLSSFMSEPVTAISPILNDVYLMEMESQRRGGSFQTAWHKYGGHFMRSVAVYSVTGIITTMVAALVSAWRDDDDYQTFGEKWQEAMDGAIIEELNPLTKLPLIGDVAEGVDAVYKAVVKGEDPMLFLSALPMGEIIQYAVDGGKILHDLISGDTNYTWYGAVRKLLQAASGATGIPAATFSREIVDVWNNIIVPMAPSLGIEDKIKTYRKDAAAEIRDAFTGGYLTEEEATEKITELVEGANGDKDKLKELGLSSIEDENDIYWKLRGWENGSDWNKYDALEQAMAKGGDISGEMDELTTHGVKEKTVRSQIRSIVGEWLAEGAITEAEARSLLMKYGERDGEEADEAVMKWRCEIDTGIPFTGIKEAYLDGEITADRAKQMYEKYGGYDPEKAEAAVERWRAEKETGTAYDDIAEAVLDGELSENQAAKMYVDYGGYEAAEAQEKAHRLAFIRDNPGCPDISSAAVADYEDYCKGAGIGAKTFYDAWKKFNATNSIKDESGKTVTSKREQVMAQIDAMNLTAKQKDALYFAFGYAESKLWDTPWH